jgi:predicted permease
MTALRVLLSRVLGLFVARRRDQELTDEIEAHLDLLAEEHLRRGLSREDARAAARRAFGGVDQVKEAYRDQRGLPFVDALGQDVRFAARLLAKDRGFTLVAVIALALGIGASNTVFTIVNAMVLRGLPVDHPDRIVAFHSGDRVLGVSYRDIEDWRAMSKTLAGFAAYGGASMTVGDEGRSPEVFSGSYISADAFRLIGEKPMLGRDFRAEDDRPGAPPVVVLGHTVWTTRYGGDPTVIGRTIRVNGVPSGVVGVMGHGFRFPLVDELWQPLAIMPGLATERRDARVLRAFGRLADWSTMAQAQAELSTIAARLAHDYPDTNKDLRPIVVPFTGSADHPMFLALFGAVGFVLLIACANVANLLLARSAQRAREISIRVSLGATRWRIVRQVLVESLLLAALAGVLGLGLSVGGVKLFADAVAGINFAYWYHDNWTMDGRVFAFVAAVSLATPLVFGLVPALNLSRRTVSDILKDGARTGTVGRGARRWMNGLLIAELAFTLILLAGAGLMMRSFLAVYRADLIVDTSHLLSMSLRLTNQKYPTSAQRIAFYQRLEERLAAVPTIPSAAVASTVPFIGAPLWQLAIEGRPPLPGGATPTVSYVRIGARYFDTLGVPLLRGRAFRDIDGTAGHESAIVNRRFVAIHFPDRDPIGQRIRLTDPNARDAASAWVTIIGISPTIRQQYLSELDPVVYLPYRANPGSSAMLMIRSDADPAALASLIREEVRALDPDVPVYRIIPLETWMTQSRWGHQVFGTMFAMFACIAVVLAAVGLYAVTAYAVTQRTQEIGVRMALGARGPQVVWLFVRRAVMPLAVGLAIGLGGALGVGRLLQSMLVQTSATDPVTLVSVAGLLVVVSTAACFWPVRRATRLDPVVALRHE